MGAAFHLGMYLFLKYSNGALSSSGDRILSMLIGVLLGNTRMADGSCIFAWGWWHNITTAICTKFDFFFERAFLRAFLGELFARLVKILYLCIVKLKERTGGL